VDDISSLVPTGYNVNMADLSSTGRSRSHELNQALEALHFAFQAVVARPDELLGRQGLSRVHHRILYFIGRNPGLSVNELLAVLKVTKQSLNAPLRQLAQRGMVVASPAEQDRRVKRLRLTSKGELLEQALSGDQRRRFALVFKEVGKSKERVWREVMRLLADG